MKLYIEQVSKYDYELHLEGPKGDTNLCLGELEPLTEYAEELSYLSDGLMVFQGIRYLETRDDDKSNEDIQSNTDSSSDS